MSSRTLIKTLGEQDKLFEDSPQLLDRDHLPPIDVLMVWHAYMLNPHAYLEDCLRYGKMRLWHTNMPWAAIAECIDPHTFIYHGTYAAQQAFTHTTRLPWENLTDRNLKTLRCPFCNALQSVPWTQCGDNPPYEVYDSSEEASQAIINILAHGNGFCDTCFSTQCQACKFQLTHKRLTVGKFCKDINNLRDGDIPMGGTVLGERGIPWMAFGKTKHNMEMIDRTPNQLVKDQLGQTILYASFYQNDEDVDLKTVRDRKEEAIKDKSYMRSVRGTPFHHMTRPERITIRKMMSRYWDNSSPFALDLVGAVIRQGVFVEKMHNIDWLHSPALKNTMCRLITKYENFLQLEADFATRMIVPTLDVDLAWHTHQLAPYRYMKCTVEHTKQFLNHDDKVPELKLNTAFAWTSMVYQQRFKAPYAECTCWYCEAVRESNSKGIIGLLSSSKSAREQLHGVVQDDPAKNVHISAHNAVRPSDDSDYEQKVDKQAAELERHFQKACQRAMKKGRPPPKRNDYYYSDAWGYPVFIPAYSPYVGALPYAPVYYPSDPGCKAMRAGAAGNCCSGTCGGGVAAGGCSHGAGHTGGGQAGNCGGGPAGGCGGGGGGGGCGGGGCGGGGC